MSEFLLEQPLDRAQSLKKLGNIALKFPQAPTEVQFLFVTHVDENDLPDDLESRITSVDSVLLEGVAWVPSMQTAHQRSSEGDINALNGLKRLFKATSSKWRFDTRLAEALHGSEKQVQYCDLPDSKATTALINSMQSTVRMADFPSFEASLNTMRSQYLAFNQKGLYARDKYILRNLYPLLDQTNAATSALFIIGSTHRTLPYVIDREAVRQSRPEHTTAEEFYGSPSDFSADMYMGYLRGEPLSADLIMRDQIAKRRSGDEQDVILRLRQSSAETVEAEFYEIMAGEAVHWAQDRVTSS